MGKNVEHIQHIKSNVVLEGKPKLPQPGVLVEGELAINYAKGLETISIENASGEVVTFSSDNYYTEQKLGSGFTGENSAVTVTDVIEENEEIISAALNDLDERKLDASAYTPSVELWESGTGLNSVVLKGSSGTASGSFAVAEGYKTSATTYEAHAEGLLTSASGTASHAEGYITSATTYASHAEGYGTFVNGDYAHAEGWNTVASGKSSHAEGERTTASANDSHAEGEGTTASGNDSHAEGYETLANGRASHTEGMSTSGTGYVSHAEGEGTMASGSYSHSEGQSTSATSYASHAEGQGTIATGQSSHVEGYNSKAFGSYSHAEGLSTTANGSQSHAEGLGSVANGTGSHAEGNGGSVAYGDGSHAEGSGTRTYGGYSHAEGQGTEASGFVAHAEGIGSKANAAYSHAEGNNTIANNQSEHASGQYNVSNSATTTFGDSGNTLFSVGNGGSNNTRHNAFEVRQNGDIYIVSGGSEILLQDNLGGDITIDQVLDDTTSASTNAIATQAVYSVITDNELVWTNAYVAMSGAVSSHTSNTSIHITSGDRTKLDSMGTMAYEDVNSYSSATQVSNALGAKVNSATFTGHTADTTVHVTSGEKSTWNAKADLSDIPSVSGYADSVKYNSTSQFVEFYHGGTGGTKVFEYDASPFLIDGMVESVVITSATISGSEVQVLEITWNSAAGGQVTDIPLSDLFDSNLYYTKTDIDTKLGSAFTGVNSAITLTAYIEENEEIISTALNDLKLDKLDVSAYTPTDLSNYYTKSETSGATEISTALSNKQNTLTQGNGIAISNDEISVNADQAINSTTSSSTKPVTTSAVYGFVTSYTPSITVDQTIDSSTSASTNPVSTNGVYEFVTAYSPSITVDQEISSATSASTGAVSTHAVFDCITKNELVISTALNDLNTAIIEDELVISASLNDINKRLGVLSAVTVNSNLSNVTCPVSVSGASNNGAQATIIYENGGSTDDYTITVDTTYKTPDGAQIELTCPADGYCEINYLNINGTIYARGV